MHGVTATNGIKEHRVAEGECLLVYEDDQAVIHTTEIGTLVSCPDNIHMLVGTVGEIAAHMAEYEIAEPVTPTPRRSRG